MDMSSRPLCRALGKCLSALVLLIAFDKSYAVDNLVPVNLEHDLLINRTIQYPAGVGHNVTQCLFEYTCRNRCKQARGTSDIYCQCDQLCWFHGDCCVDYYSECLGVGIENPDSVVIRALLAQLRSYYDFLRFYRALRWARLSSCQKVNSNYTRVVRACDSDPEVNIKFERLREKLSQSGANENAFVGISSADIVYECERRITDNDHLTLPVSLIQDHIVHFYNVFCAICNGIDPHETLAWNVSITNTGVAQFVHDTQNSTHTKILTSTKREILISTVLDRRWCIQYRDDLLGKGESVQGSSDNEARNNQSIGAMSEAKVNNTYGLCKSNDLVSSFICGRFLRPYIIKPGDDLLKNQYCTLCNEDSVAISCLTNQCFCPDNNYAASTNTLKFSGETGSGSAFEHLPNLKDLFYFRDKSVTKWVNETAISIETKTCPENKVFSRFYDQCIDIVCPDGTISRTLGQCPVTTSTRCNGDKETCEGGAGRNSAESVLYPQGSTTVSLVFNFQRVTDLNDVAVDETEYGADSGQIEYGVSVTKDNTKENMANRGTLDGMPETGTSFTNTRNVKRDTKKTGHADEEKSKVNAFTELPLSLQSMKSIWVSQISTMRTWNFTKAFTEIWRNMYVVPDNEILMKDVQFSIKATESRPVTGNDGGHGNSSSPACQQHIEVRFSYNDSCISNAILSLVEKEIVPRVMDSAHKNNHILAEVRLTNADIQKTEVCRSGRRKEKISVNVTAERNGTYTAHLDRFSAHSIDNVMYSLAVIMDDTGDIRLCETAEVVVCVVNISTSNCSMVLYASADIVEYEDHLVITRHAAELLRFLSDSTASRGASLSDKLKIFTESNNASDFEVYPMGAYVMSHSGAYVCSDYSKNYSVRNETVIQVLRRFRTFSDSVPEQIATVLALAVSITCLVVVLTVYGLVPEMRNTPGKIVMSMSSTLLLAQVMLLCSTYPKGLTCGIYAAVQHAAWLGSSAWLAAMAAHLRHVLYSPSIREEKSIFGLLAFLCWGLPSLLAGTCFTLDRIGLVDLEYDSGHKCWLNNTYITIFAFGVPLLFLVSTTFICSVFIVRAIQKSTEFVKKATKDRQRARCQLLVCINIASLMGLDWAIYFIAMLADTEAVWIQFILANGLQGLFLFLCYAAKRSVMKKLMKRWRHRPAVTSEIRSSSGVGSTWVTTSKK